MATIVCVGDLMVDVVARLPGPLAPGSDTPSAVDLHGGGAAANVAAWLAAEGVRATFVGRVGDDAFGRHAVDELTAAGVTVAISVDPDRPTGTCVVLVDPAGERTMIPSAGANSGLGDLDPAAALPAAAECLYLSGYALLNPGSRPFALGCLALARQRGWRIAVDAASAAPLAGAGADTFAGWVGGDVLLFANEDEARVLAGTVDITALAVRFGEAVLKTGREGAHWSDGTHTKGVLACPVTADVDSTGAGDAFAAGFLAARCSGTDVAGCLLAGAALGARAVAQVGARPPRP